MCSVLPRTREETAYSSQGAALEFPPLIYLAGGTAITKYPSETPDNLIQQLLLIAKVTDEGRWKERKEESWHK